MGSIMANNFPCNMGLINGVDGAKYVGLRPCLSLKQPAIPTTTTWLSRSRRSHVSRVAFHETNMTPAKFVYPLFSHEGGHRRNYLYYFALTKRKVGHFEASRQSRIEKQKLPKKSTQNRKPIKKKDESDSDYDWVKTICVGELPSEVREEQDLLLQKGIRGEFCGGIDKESFISWIICGGRLFVWNNLSPAATRNCVILDIPSSVRDNNWILSVVSWDINHNKKHEYVQTTQSQSAGIILCNQTTQSLIYWPDIYSETGKSPVTNDEMLVSRYVPPIGFGHSPHREQDRSNVSKKKEDRGRVGNNSSKSIFLHSLIASPIPGCNHSCVAFACSSNGELWKFYCSPNDICRNKVYHETLDSVTCSSNGGRFLGGKNYPRSLIWRFSSCHRFEETDREFFLLTDREIQCFSVGLFSNMWVKKLWSHEIIGVGEDFEIQKSLSPHRRIWLLDLQVLDTHGKVISVIVATSFNYKYRSSSHIEYSILTMHYRSGVNHSRDMAMHEKVLEKKFPIQVIIPKARIPKAARVEADDFMFSMKLRIGGKPYGSAIILSGDGTAAVFHYLGNCTRLYRLDLPYGAGKVLDTSIFPSLDGDEDGEWVVLTERAGICVIPGKAILPGGVTQKKEWTVSFGQKSKTLQLFHEFISSGQLFDNTFVNLPFAENYVYLPDRDNDEVFYNKVSDFEEFFSCLDKHLVLLISSDMSLAVQLERVCELSNACVNLIRTVGQQYINKFHKLYPLPDGLSPWYSQPKVRSGMWSVAFFMLQMLSEISHLDLSNKSDFYSNLEALTEELLDAYSCAITAKVDRGDDHKRLLDEYWKMIDSILDSLYQLVKSIAQARYEDFNEATEEQREVIFKELSSNLMHIAKRNQGYQVMRNLCCDVNDSELLKNLTQHESTEQLYSSKQLSELMRLGEGFQEENSMFPKQHRDLLPFHHQVYLHQYFSVSKTSHELTFSEHSNSISEITEGIECDLNKKETTLAERKSFLRPSKIVAVAAEAAQATLAPNRNSIITVSFKFIHEEKQ